MSLDQATTKIMRLGYNHVIVDKQLDTLDLTIPSVILNTKVIGLTMTYDFNKHDIVVEKPDDDIIIPVLNVTAIPFNAFGIFTRCARDVHGVVLATQYGKSISMMHWKLMEYQSFVEVIERWSKL